MPEPITGSDYIAYADDVTQITYSYSTSVNYIAKITQRAIKSINDYERKWKIKTNMNKFHLSQMQRKKTGVVRIDDTPIEYKKYDAKMLGLHFQYSSIIKNVTHRKNLADLALSKLYRFKGLSQKNLSKLYTSMVRSALVYPVIPMNTLSRLQFSRLQTIQNKFLKFQQNI